MNETPEHEGEQKLSPSEWIKKQQLTWKIMWYGAEALNETEKAFLNRLVQGRKSKPKPEQHSATSTTRAVISSDKPASTDSIWGTGLVEAQVNHEIDVDEADFEAQELVKKLRSKAGE